MNRQKQERSKAIKWLSLTLCTFLFAPLALSQPPSPPAFEVATIKPIDVNGFKGSGIAGFISYPGGRILLGSANLPMVIYYAYNVQPYQISGVPDWAKAAHYDIVALPSESSPSRTVKQAGIKATPSEEQRKMLQSLLADRFALKYHSEARDGAVFILGKNDGQKLRLDEPKDKDADSRAGVITRRARISGNENEVAVSDGEAFGTNITMHFFAETLTRDLGRPVIDQTGLTGSYDFHLEADDPTNQDHTQAVLDAIKRLGLTLKSGKGPIDTIVIDSVSKPTEN